MALIPEPLSARVELFKQLETAYDLLDALHSSGTRTEAEETFLQRKIDSIEMDLNNGEAEAGCLINELQSDPVAWTVARLRFMQGYEWTQAAARAGVSADVAKTRVYRFYQKRSRSGRGRP